MNTHSLRDQLSRDILKRFLPGHDGEEASLHLLSTFESSEHAYFQFLSDWIHNLCTTTISSVSSSALGYVNSALTVVGAAGAALGEKWRPDTYTRRFEL